MRGARGASATAAFAVEGSAVWPQRFFVNPQNHRGSSLVVRRTTDGVTVTFPVARSHEINRRFTEQYGLPRSDAWYLEEGGWNFATISVFRQVDLDVNQPGWQPGDRIVVVQPEEQGT